MRYLQISCRFCTYKKAQNLHSVNLGFISSSRETGLRSNDGINDSKPTIKG